jgi:hypothetical protein
MLISFYHAKRKQILILDIFLRQARIANNINEVAIAHPDYRNIELYNLESRRAKVAEQTWWINDAKNIFQRVRILIRYMIDRIRIRISIYITII